MKTLLNRAAFIKRSGMPIHELVYCLLTLGWSGEEGFVPLDSELFTSVMKAQALHQPFWDGRSRVVNRYRVARDQTKPDMGKAMIRRALRDGIEAEYLLADAWFGAKPMLRTTENALLTAVLRMKKSTMKYRYTAFRQGKVIHRDRDVKALYRTCIRGQWDKIPGFRNSINSPITMLHRVDAHRPDRGQHSPGSVSHPGLNLA